MIDPLIRDRAIPKPAGEKWELQERPCLPHETVFKGCHSSLDHLKPLSRMFANKVEGYWPTVSVTTKAHPIPKGYRNLVCSTAKDAALKRVRGRQSM
jgi:hypothetical protein